MNLEFLSQAQGIVYKDGVLYRIPTNGGEPIVFTPGTAETDPVFSASPAAGITTSNITDWNTAYSWGNHASAGYLTTESDTLDSVTTRGNTTLNTITVGGITATGVTSTIYAGAGTRLRTEANNLVFERVSSSGFMKFYINQTTLSPTAKAYMGYNNATLNVILSNEHSTGNLELRTQDIVRQYIFANGNVVIGSASPTDAGYKLDVIGIVRTQEIRTGAHSFRDQMYISHTTDGYTKQNAYNAANAYALTFVGDLRFASNATIKAVFAFNGSYSNNGTIYHGDSSLMKLFTGDAFGNTIGAANINGYGVNLMPTLNYTTGTSTFTGFFYNPTVTATTGLTHYAMDLVTGVVKLRMLAGTGDRMVVADSNGVLSTQAIPSGSGPTPTLDQVTTAGNTTTNPITVGGVTVSGYSVIGSSAQSALDISGTWNTTGTPTLIKANVTNTASNAGSMLLDLQVGGSSRFSVRNDGVVNVSNEVRNGNMTQTTSGLRFGNASGYMQLGGSSGSGTFNNSGGAEIDLYGWNAGTNAGSIIFRTGISSTSNQVEVARITSLGNLLIGTTTDAGYKLDVAGNTRVNGGNTSADTPFIINNRFQFKGDGALLFGASSDRGRLTWDGSGAYFTGLSGYGVGIGANGVLNHLFITTVGNVGIGTTAATYRLDVKGTATTHAVSSDIGYNINGVAAPTTGSLALVVSAGNVDLGLHYYYVTFTTALGETNPFQIGSITTVSGSQQVTVTIPTSTDPRVTGRKLYRTKAGGAFYDTFVLATIANNTATTYTDNIADASLTGTIGTGFYQVNTTHRAISVNGIQSLVVDPYATYLGVNAGAGVTSAGGNNTFIGYNSGRYAASANQSVGLGNSALGALTSGSNNIGIGSQAGSLLTVAGNNILIGRNAGVNINTGSENAIIGSFAWNLGTVTGKLGNTGLGTRVGSNNTGNYNLFLGYEAGYYVTGSNQILLDTVSRADEATAKSSALIYGVTSGTAANQTLSLGGGGNVMIGTITNAGYKLDVVGTTRVQGTSTITPAADTSAIVSTGYSVTGSGTTPLIDLSGTWNTTGAVTLIKANVTDTASGSLSYLLDLQVGSSTRFRVSKLGETRAISGFYSGTNFASTSGFVAVNPDDSGTTITNATNTSIRFSDFRSGAIAGYSYWFSSFQYVNLTHTSGTGGFIAVERSFAPTSGTGIFNIIHLRNTINQTGGANGITRGLYIQPTVTAAADWRAIESTNGRWVLTDTYSAGSGSLANPTLDISTTWNTTGTPTLIKANVTATATGGLNNVRLIDLQIGGASHFSVNGFGAVVAPLSFSASTTTSFRNITFGGTVSENTYSASSNIQPTAGTRNIYFSSISFTPTSGTATLTNFIVAGSINQTGGANGITRGLYVNPTLTAAADWRSIEWTNNAGWGLYGTGTGLNHLNGSLLVGTTTNAGYKLDVNGTVRVQGDITCTSLVNNGPVMSLSGVLTSVTGYTGMFTVPTNPPGQQTLVIQDGIIVNVM